MSEPEPPPGGFLWDFMDMLWFTGVLSWHPTRSTAWAFHECMSRLCIPCRKGAILIARACPAICVCICPIGAVGGCQGEHAQEVVDPDVLMLSDMLTWVMGLTFMVSQVMGGVLRAACVLRRQQEEQPVPEEASDSLDVPSSPAPSEYGSYASSVSRFRYSTDARSPWASHNDLLTVQACCICFNCSAPLSYSPPTLPVCWGNRQCGVQDESKFSVGAAPEHMMPYAHCILYACRKLISHLSHVQGGVTAGDRRLGPGA